MRLSMQVRDSRPEMITNIVPTLLAFSFTKEEIEILFGNATPDQRYVNVSGSWKSGYHVSRCEDYQQRQAADGRIVNSDDQLAWTYRLTNRTHSPVYIQGFNAPGPRMGLPNKAIPSITVEAEVREVDKVIGLWFEPTKGVEIEDPRVRSKYFATRRLFADIARKRKNTSKHNEIVEPKAAAAPPPVAKPLTPLKTVVVSAKGPTESEINALRGHVLKVNEFIAKHPDFMLTFTKSKDEYGVEVSVLRTKIEVETI